MVALGIAIGAGFIVSAFLRQRGPDAVSFTLEIGGLSLQGDQLTVLLASQLSFIVVFVVWRALLEPVGILLTDRRMIRPTGMYRWPLEVLAYADIAEVRRRGSRITLVARGPDDMRRLNRKGDSAPIAEDRIEFQAARWKLFGSGETRNEKALRIVGGGRMT